MKNINIGRLNNINIESILDTLYLTIETPNFSNNLNGYNILGYINEITTEKKDGKFIYNKQYFIFKNIKFSCSGSKLSTYIVRNLKENFIIIGKHENSISELRKFKLKLIC